MTLHWQSNEVELDELVQLTSEINVEVGFSALLLDHMALKHQEPQRRL